MKEPVYTIPAINAFWIGLCLISAALLAGLALACDAAGNLKVK